MLRQELSEFGQARLEPLRSTDTGRAPAWTECVERAHAGQGKFSRFGRAALLADPLIDTIRLRCVSDARGRVLCEAHEPFRVTPANPRGSHARQIAPPPGQGARRHTEPIGSVLDGEVERAGDCVVAAAVAEGTHTSIDAVAPGVSHCGGAARLEPVSVASLSVGRAQWGRGVEAVAGSVLCRGHAVHAQMLREGLERVAAFEAGDGGAVIGARWCSTPAKTSGAEECSQLVEVVEPLGAARTDVGGEVRLATPVRDEAAQRVPELLGSFAEGDFGHLPMSLRTVGREMPETRTASLSLIPACRLAMIAPWSWKRARRSFSRWVAHS